MSNVSAVTAVAVEYDSILHERMARLWKKVYVQDGGIGFASYHFFGIRSYISYTNMRWKDDNGNPVPFVRIFEDIKFDPEQRIFEAVINWTPVTVNNGDYKWIYKMIFSEDYSIIIDGTCIVMNRSGTSETIQFVLPSPSTTHFRGLSYTEIISGY